MSGVLVTPSVVIFIAESRINTTLTSFPSPLVLHTVRKCYLWSTVRKSRLLPLGRTVAKVSVFNCIRCLLMLCIVKKYVFIHFTRKFEIFCRHWYYNINHGMVVFFYHCCRLALLWCWSVSGFLLKGDPDTAYYDGHPDPASQNDVDPGSATLYL